MVVKVLLALSTCLIAGALFRFHQIPIPAPPNISGVLGIVGIYAGYKFVEWADLGVDVLATLNRLV